MPTDVGLAPIFFKGRSLAGMTLTTGAYTQVNLNNPVFTAPRPAALLVSAAVLFDMSQGTTNPARACVIYKNGAVLEGSVVWGNYPNNFFSLTVPVLPVDVVTGDTLELRAYGALTGTKLYADSAGGPGSVMTIWERT